MELNALAEEDINKIILIIIILSYDYLQCYKHNFNFTFYPVPRPVTMLPCLADVFQMKLEQMFHESKYRAKYI